MCKNIKYLHTDKKKYSLKALIKVSSKCKCICTRGVMVKITHILVCIAVVVMGQRCADPELQSEGRGRRQIITIGSQTVQDNKREIKKERLNAQRC